jgi:hypothetical protein
MPIYAPRLWPNRRSAHSSGFRFKRCASNWQSSSPSSAKIEPRITPIARVECVGSPTTNGLENPEGERPGGTEQTCGASGAERSVELRVVPILAAASTEAIDVTGWEACLPETAKVAIFQNQKMISKSLMPFHFPWMLGSNDVLSTQVP